MFRGVILLIVLAFPVAEGTLLYRLAHGPAGSGAWVLAWLLFAAAAGVVLIKHARFSLIARLGSALSQGHFSLAALIDSFRTVLAGLLLIFPGILSDIMAMLVLLWPIREPVLQSAAVHERPIRRGRVIDADFRRED
ncbi:MAG: FxsA family protein [Betaproteobacteria bacterium]|nr:FxsA family protein [Betaproteobacteria bacterium]